MRQRDQNPRADMGETLESYLPAFLAIVVMVAGFLSSLMIVQLDLLQPKVGDLVVFKQGAMDGESWQMEIAASDRFGTTCILNPAIMAESGGSVVIEQRDLAGDKLYRVHWAGGRTADGAAGCGTAAELTVTRKDLQKLANAAGGFGIGNKGVVW